MTTPLEVALAKTIEAREALTQATAALRSIIGTDPIADETRLRLSLAEVYALDAYNRLNRQVIADRRRQGRPLLLADHGTVGEQRDEGSAPENQPRRVPRPGGGRPDPGR